jgi:glucosamine--fructose-6-phosphate aminotransferase (isomerizing)
LIERLIGIPVAAAAPNIASVYKSELKLRHQLFLVISQSGRSDDLVEATRAARASGALTAAILNATDSPVATECDIVLPMAAGPELGVAATKTFVSTLSALVRLAASWLGRDELNEALRRLPGRLAAASDLDWGAAVDGLARAESLVALGRGPTLAIAREASLKLKETCDLHAEAFSGAEFLHGPVALVRAGYPILMFMPTDEAADSMRQLARDPRLENSSLFVAEAGAPTKGRLPALARDVPETDAICLIQTFYAAAVQLAKKRGTDIDRPRHLQKVTRTR